MAMRAKKSKKAVESAEAYCDGRSRNTYQLRANIKAGCVLSVELMQLLCLQCKSLLDLCSIFDSFFRDLKRHKAIYPKPAGCSYANVKEQYNYLISTVFAGKDNYLYHQNCVRHNTIINHHNRITLVASIAHTHTSFMHLLQFFF